MITCNKQTYIKIYSVLKIILKNVSSLRSKLNYLCLSSLLSYLFLAYQSQHSNKKAAINVNYLQIIKLIVVVIAHWRVSLQKALVLPTSKSFL